MYPLKTMLNKGLRYWVLHSLLRLTRIQLVNTIDSYSFNKTLTVDMGCNIGQVTRYLSLFSEPIGLDIDVEKVRWAKKCNPQIDFVCCDLSYLPIRPSSTDVAVCASVFEHIKNLDHVLNEIHSILKEKGKLVAGYPIETRLLDVIMHTFWSSESYVWSLSNLSNNKGSLRHPNAHKQSYVSIRMMLLKYFNILERKKFPISWFLDLGSIYEKIVLEKK